jgi:hypothetical protein
MFEVGGFMLQKFLYQGRHWIGDCIEPLASVDVVAFSKVAEAGLYFLQSH